MSDGMTDAATDNKRAERFDAWIGALMAYLESGRGDAAVGEAANRVAAVRGGLATDPLPDFKAFSDRMLAKLPEGDREAWRDLMATSSWASPSNTERLVAQRCRFANE